MLRTDTQRRPDEDRTLLHAALSFTPDTYGRGDKALGRHVANTAFLRAAIEAHRGQPIVGYGYEAHHGPEFQALVKSIEPEADTRWLLMSQAEELAPLGVIHRLDPAIQAEVSARAWVGLGRYSISAVAHTTFSLLPGLAQYVREPLMSWDALVCASPSVRSTIEAVWAAEMEYARWRYGASASPPLPQLRVIPLGVHTAQFLFTEAQRREARDALGVSPDEIVALYVGRLSLMSRPIPARCTRACRPPWRERAGRSL